MLRVQPRPRADINRINLRLLKHFGQISVDFHFRSFDTGLGILLVSLLGAALSALWHDIGSGGAQWSLADFQALVDYVRVKALAGQIYPITMADYYRLSQGAAAVAKVK